MSGLFRLLLAAAVLWCGLHLSPAEADGGVWTGADAVAHARAPDHGDDGHPGTDAVHGCHNHCPVAPDIGPSPAVGAVGRGQSMLFARPSWSLTTAAQAPPIEPPAA
ncbi:hypothetical protein V5740_13445 [Croceibacterium sp. TMG7-5b_MA50]|uniref:hypothetical protein n=1 Tax=Croceibacterium sp. TMG7-5b_MA50 TaxID=3121290 RepID=UPI0032218F29